MSQFFAPGGQSIGVSASASAFFMVHLSHPYTTTGKTIAWTRWTLVGKVMSLLFNMLFRFVNYTLIKIKQITTDSWVPLRDSNSIILHWGLGMSIL